MGKNESQGRGGTLADGTRGTGNAPAPEPPAESPPVTIIHPTLGGGPGGACGHAGVQILALSTILQWLDKGAKAKEAN